MNKIKSLITQFINAMQKRPGLLAVLAFCSGITSYVLVDRKESFAQVVALVLLISWLWLIVDNWLRDKVEERFGVSVSPNVTRFALQMIQQESLFFALPFFLVVTQWDHPQAVFTSLIILCAVASVIDPFYYKKLAKNRTLFTVFHNFALFVVLLVTLPILFSLTTSQSLAAALVIAVVLTLPSLTNLMPNAPWWRLPILAIILFSLSVGIWQLKSFVPPAALHLTSITLAHEVNEQSKKPIGNINSLNERSLHAKGLYTWTAVKAPRGLNEKIFHVWTHNKKQVDKIALNISGGRKSGYRAWTHKVNFPQNAAGKWQVKVMTESGQLIGLTKFTVTH
jgi:hypothetical protein